MRMKKGSILIEVLACTFILSFFCIFIGTTCLKCSMEYEKRIEEEKVNRIVNMIVKEIKYNISKSELEKLFGENNKAGFKYKDDLIKELQYEDLWNVERGCDIEIEKESEDSSGVSYKIKVNVIKENFNIEQDYEFQKSWWMDEV